MKKTLVASISIKKNYKQALNKTIDTFPEVKKKLKESKNIYIKIGIDHLYNFQHTNLELLQLILEYIRQTNSSSKIFIMENNIYGNFTRLLANVSGAVAITKSYKAKFIYLDEKKASPITIGSPEDRYKILFPEILIDQLIAEQQKCFYLNLSFLKTHYQAKIAGGLFNQVGLINQQSFRYIHSSYLHHTIVDLLRYIKPDFTIVDANVILAHGSMPAECLIKKYAILLDRLIAGVDAVAVDRVAFELTGYSQTQIEHLKLAIEQGLGEGNLDNIEIKGDLLSRSYKIPYSFEVSQLPQRMDIVFGEKKVDVENCLGLTLQFAQILFKDFLGNRGFSLVVGRDFNEQQLQRLREPVIVLGKETCDEVAPYITSHYERSYYIGRCDNIRQIFAVLIKVMGCSKYHLIGVNPLTVWKYLVIGKLNGLKYKLPSIDKNTKRWKIQKKSGDKKAGKENN